MIVVLLIVHGLLAVVLLGAITHQAFSVARRVPAVAVRNVVDKFRGVSGGSYTNTIVILYVVTTVLGGFLYPQYRIDVRPTLEDLQLRAANGVFEMKEHLVAIGLGLLPAYWLFWQTPAQDDTVAPRKYLTWILAILVWWGFLIGHVLNNIKGLLPS